MTLMQLCPAIYRCPVHPLPEITIPNHDPPRRLPARVHRMMLRWARVLDSYVEWRPEITVGVLGSMEKYIEGRCGRDGAVPLRLVEDWYERIYNDAGIYSHPPESKIVAEEIWTWLGIPRPLGGNYPRR